VGVFPCLELLKAVTVDLMAQMERSLLGLNPRVALPVRTVA